jgi:ABC-2 type transport system permease protein
MSRWPIVARTLYQLRWQVISYGLGLAAWAFLVVIIYPSVSKEFENVQFPDFYEAIFGDQIRDITKPTTFMTLEYMTWVPIVLGVYAVVGSTGLLAGEESRGSADFLFVQPLSRRRIFLEKSAAWLIGAVLAVLLTALGFLLGSPVADMGGENGVTVFSFLGASLVALPLVSFYAALGLLVGAVAPSRGSASGVLTVALVAGYVFSSFAQLAQATEWLRYLSPFYYGGITEVLNSGVRWEHQALLIAAALILGGLGLLAFERREIGVGGWQRPWRGGR